MWKKSVPKNNTMTRKTFIDDLTSLISQLAQRTKCHTIMINNDRQRLCNKTT